MTDVMSFDVNYQEHVAKKRSTHAVEVAKSRVEKEIQAALLYAAGRPRDVEQSFIRIMESCRRPSMASIALYAYPRGGTTVTGINIRLAELMAALYRNLDYGWKQIESEEGRSLVLSYCWDLETNVNRKVEFWVPHEMKSGNGIKKLTDPNDIYFHVANMAVRRMRSQILGLLPADLLRAAEAQCKKTMADEAMSKPITKREADALKLFAAFSVTQQMIEKRYDTTMGELTGEDWADLGAVYSTLNDKEGSAGDFFDVPGGNVKPSDGTKEAGIKERLLSIKKE